MKGVLLAAIFSYGCKRAEDLEISEKLKEYALSGGKSHTEEEIRGELKKLFSYIYYRIIALANNIEDRFDIRVVRAHWIGSNLLDKVQPVHIALVSEEMQKVYNDKVVLGRIFTPVVKSNSVHHNYCAMSEKCQVSLENGWFCHLEIKTIEAGSEDKENLEKWGLTRF